MMALGEEAYAAMDTADLHDLIGICEERLEDLRKLKNATRIKRNVLSTVYHGIQAS